MNASESKHKVRQQVLRHLRTRPTHRVEEDSARLRAMLAPILQASAPQNVAIYVPMAHEVNLLPLLQEYPQHHYAVPRCLPERRMEFHLIRDAHEDTAPGAHGIPAPHEHLPIIPAELFDLILVPGVAFTPNGQRLGYGGGYYDRYLPRCSRAKRIALAFAEQLLPQLPTEEHDLRIQYLYHL